MKRSSACCVIALSVSLFACSRAEPTPAPAPPPPISVDTVEVTTVEAPQRLLLTGSLRGDRETDLAANVAGRVLRTEVERGQSVATGALLARVDIQAARLALAEAEVSVQTSETQVRINRAECERYEKLQAAGVVTPLEYEQVTAKCKTAPLQLEAARARQSLAAKNVGDGMIRAPFSGVVAERFVEVGEYVQPSTRVVSLVQTDTLRAVFSVPEKHYPMVKDGAEVFVSVAAYPDQRFAGKVAHVSGAVRATRDVVVEATIPNPEGRLLPGMFAQVELAIGSRTLPSIPPTAAFEQNGKTNVLVATEDHLEQRIIAVEEEVAGRVPVRRGLRAGEQVVAAYDPALKNGDRIQ